MTRHLIKLAKEDKKIMAITPAMANGSKLNSFKNLYPDRFIDVGIAEEHALVLANAVSLEGLKPFVSIYSTFLQRGYDEVAQEIGRMNGHVVIGIDRAGIVGEDGETHQGIYDVTLLNNIPNMIIMAPSDSKMAGDMLYTAFRVESPVAIRYSKERIDFIESSYKLLEIGKWEISDYREKESCDGYLISYGDFYNRALEIREFLKKKNIYLRVVNARFIKPMDKKILKEISKQNKPVFIYEEVVRIGSLGSEIAKYLLEHHYNNIFYDYAIPDEFIKQGKKEEVIKSLKLDNSSIIKDIEKRLKCK